jgi:hypothetical protein
VQERIGDEQRQEVGEHCGEVENSGKLGNTTHQLDLVLRPRSSSSHDLPSRVEGQTRDGVREVFKRLDGLRSKVDQSVVGSLFALAPMRSGEG